MSIPYPAPVPSVRPPRDHVAALLRTAAGDAHAAAAFERLARVTATMLGAPTTMLTMLDADAPALLRVRGAHGLPATAGCARVLRTDDAPCRDVIGQLRSVAISDVRTHPTLSALPLVQRIGIVAYLGVPLVARNGRLLGVLCAFDVVPRPWSEHEVALLRELCEFAVGELERLEELARRRRAEDALRTREALFRAVFDRASQFMAVCSPDGVLVDANQAAFDLVRVDAFEVVGRPLWNAVWWSWCSAQRDAVADALHAAGDGRAARCRVQYLGDDGERHPVDLTATPVHDDDGAVSFILVEGRDLSEPRLAPVRCADPTCAYADALGATALDVAGIGAAARR